jgi:hypothetical protein
MTNDVKSTLDLITDAVKVCTEHYNHSFSRFNTIDAKAQGSITTAGVLLGAMLAFVPHPVFTSVLKKHGALSEIVVWALLASAFCAVLLGILALSARPGRTPYRGDIVAASVEDLLNLSDRERNAAIIEAHYLRQLIAWREAIIELTLTLRTKARALLLAQAFLTGAAMMAGGFIVLAIQTFV